MTLRPIETMFCYRKDVEATSLSVLLQGTLFRHLGRGDERTAQWVIRETVFAF